MDKCLIEVIFIQKCNGDLYAVKRVKNVYSENNGYRIVYADDSDEIFSKNDYEFVLANLIWYKN